MSESAKNYYTTTSRKCQSSLTKKVPNIVPHTHPQTRPMQSGGNFFLLAHPKNVGILSSLHGYFVWKRESEVVNPFKLWPKEKWDQTILASFYLLCKYTMKREQKQHGRSRIQIGLVFNPFVRHKQYGNLLHNILQLINISFNVFFIEFETTNSEFKCKWSLKKPINKMLFIGYLGWRY